MEEETDIFFDILQSNVNACLLDIERETNKHINERFGKSVVLSQQKRDRDRGYLEDGGKQLARSDIEFGVVKFCPKCQMNLFDKEPDYMTTTRSLIVR